MNSEFSTVEFPHIRFEAKIRKREDGCWEWTGAKTKHGYGKFIMGSRRNGTRKFVSAHRFSYRFYKGPIPDGMAVMRRCESKSCVSPYHLSVGDQKKVVNAAVKKRRFHPWDYVSRDPTTGRFTREGEDGRPRLGGVEADR